MSEKQAIAKQAVIPEEHLQFHIDGGLAQGLLITTGTQILIQLSFANHRYEQLSILNSVIKKLGIEPSDFEVLRRNDQKHTHLDYDNDEPLSWE